MGKKVIAVLLLSMVMNLSGPVAVIAHGMAAGGIISSSALLQFLSIFTLPIQQINKIVQNENPLSDGINNTADRCREDAPADTCYSSGQRSNGSSTVQWAVNGFCAMISLIGYDTLLHHWPPNGRGFIYVVMLAYFILLARGNLPDNSMRIRVRRE